MQQKIGMGSVALGAALLLSACGGGDEGGGGGSGHASPVLRIDYAAAQVAPAQSTDASACQHSPNGIAMGEQVLKGKHTVTYATSGVSEAQQRKTAQYAEASVAYIREKLGFADDGVGFGDGVPIAICALSTGSGGSGFSQSLEVSVNNIGDHYLKELVLHELIHVSHSRLANCGKYDPGYYITSKWFSEGAALYLAGQDTYSKSDAVKMRASMGHESPYSWIENGWFGFERYPVYRLAVEALVETSGHTEDDLWAFTRAYFTEHNTCSSYGYQTFNAAISKYFGNLLEDESYVNSFWTTTLDKYAK